MPQKEPNFKGFLNRQIFTRSNEVTTLPAETSTLDEFKEGNLADYQ